MIKLHLDLSIKRHHVSAVSLGTTMIKGYLHALCAIQKQPKLLESVIKHIADDDQ